MSNTFKIGDKVRIAGSKLDNTGEIISTQWNIYYQQFDYKVKIGGLTRYCIKDELELVSKKVGIKCECGAHSALGMSCSILQHALYCPLRREYEGEITVNDDFGYFTD